MNKFSGAVLGLVALTAVSSANLVVNGDFQAASYPNNGFTSPLASLSGWTILGVGNVAGIGQGYLGAPSQELDVSGTADTANSGISQVLPTIGGFLYEIKFDVYTGFNTTQNGGVNASFGATALGTNLKGQNSGNGRKTYTFMVNAASANQAIKFTNAATGRVAHVDNVSVVEAVPEPATIAGMSMFLIALARKRKK